jgi:hypothetical protein
MQGVFNYHQIDKAEFGIYCMSPPQVVCFPCHLGCDVPIFGFSCSASGDDFQGLCQHDRSGDLMLPVSSEGLEELYDSRPGLFIIFHHRDHSNLLCSHFSIPMHFDHSCNLGVILSIFN